MDLLLCSSLYWQGQILFKQGQDSNKIWTEIQNLVVKTILCGHKDILQSVSSEVKSDYSCYKLFGVDVFLDSDLKPWLLELNNFPSLEPDSLDRSGRSTGRQAGR